MAFPVGVTFWEPYEISKAVAYSSVYGRFSTTIVLFSPFSVIAGGIVSTLTSPLVRSARVTIPAYLVDFDQITIKSLTLTDNNHASSDYVKAGDTVTLTLITDGSDVGNATGHIFGDTSLSSSISGNRITFTKTVYENDTNGLATFEIFVRNSTGYAGIVTRADLTSGDVSVDTIPPAITLNGENNTIVVLNRPYTEEYATAFDISYGSQNVTPTGNATGHIYGDTSLSSSISGNRITFTKTVYENDTNGLATFEIFVRNSTGYAGIVTRADLTSGDVSVDTIPPAITLNGENNTIVVLNRPYTEEYATAFDISYGSQNVTPTGNATGHIFGDTSLSSSISGNRITFTKTVYENDTNGLATFEIFVRNSTGYAGIVTRADLTSGDVSVDTIPPAITLNGENNTIVVLNRPYTLDHR